MTAEMRGSPLPPPSSSAPPALMRSPSTAMNYSQQQQQNPVDPALHPQQPPEQEQYCLRWNNYQSNLTTVFDELLRRESFVDVTLSTDEGHAIKCHKVSQLFILVTKRQRESRSQLQITRTKYYLPSSGI